MKERRVLKKILGVMLAVIGAIIIIEAIPLIAWYCVLGALCIGLIIFLIL